MSAKMNVPVAVHDHRAALLQSFSAIVGPNGSGKSNVIDAMLFVFGKRAKQVSTTWTGCCSRIDHAA
jgi:ABC-type Mn2+/Zn2+ transport system ATPase subunit